MYSEIISESLQRNCKRFVKIHSPWYNEIRYQNGASPCGEFPIKLKGGYTNESWGKSRNYNCYGKISKSS